MLTNQDPHEHETSGKMSREAPQYRQSLPAYAQAPRAAPRPVARARARLEHARAGGAVKPTLGWAAACAAVVAWFLFLMFVLDTYGISGWLIMVGISFLCWLIHVARVRGRANGPRP